MSSSSARGPPPAAASRRTRDEASEVLAQAQPLEQQACGEEVQRGDQGARHLCARHQLQGAAGAAAAGGGGECGRPFRRAASSELAGRRALRRSSATPQLAGCAAAGRRRRRSLQPGAAARPAALCRPRACSHLVTPSRGSGSSSSSRAYSVATSHASSRARFQSRVHMSTCRQGSRRSRRGRRERERGWCTGWWLHATPLAHSTGAHRPQSGTPHVGHRALGPQVKHLGALHRGVWQPLCRRHRLPRRALALPRVCARGGRARRREGSAPLAPAAMCLGRARGPGASRVHVSGCWEAPPRWNLR